MTRLLRLLICCAALAGGSRVRAEIPPSVAGFQRLGLSVEGGELLLSELSCLACHRDDARQPPGLAWKAGPNLAAVGDRLRADYLRQFLLDPGNTKPGTTMPGVLAGRPEAARRDDAENLTHFLRQLRAAEQPAPAANGHAATGGELFHDIGCIACHAADSLPRLGEKYAPGQLAHFLARPLDARPAGRMPDLHLTAQEAADLAAFLAPDVPKIETPFIVDPDKAQRGAQAFQSLGCIACHGGVSGGKALAGLNPQAGCLAPVPIAGVPYYPLSAEQRGAIRMALEARGHSLPSDDPKAGVRRLMLQRNCFACHLRGGLGGPAPEIAEHFTSARDDLGDLGRMPPPLDGVGRKLQTAALGNILRGQNRVRSYMKVRMPDFGPELAEHLGPLFAAADADADELPTVAKTNPNQVGRNEAGREIVGIKGYACISCHELHGHASLGIGAYDLAEMPKRLRPEWMRDFLLDPAAFPTGTRMPAFWPKGKPMNPKLGGGAERQIDSIRVYLSEVDQSLPPEGFIDHAAFELKPSERPIVFRTFIESVGTHAVAVGFPQGINVAFDALRARWALAWRGRFLDADGTWHQRAAKIEKPLGEHIVTLDLGRIRLTGKSESSLSYRGYRVNADGGPSFLYDLGPYRVEDRIAIESTGLRRTVRVSGDADDAVEYLAPPASDAAIRVTGQPESGSRLEFKGGVAEFTERISW